MRYRIDDSDHAYPKVVEARNHEADCTCGRCYSTLTEAKAKAFTEAASIRDHWIDICKDLRNTTKAKARGGA